jgi:ComF family protein
VIAPWLYDEPMAHLIGQWKYHRKHWLTPLLAELWIRHYQTAAAVGRTNEAVSVNADVDVMVPVPIAPMRLLSRGFNQASLLATEIQRRLPQTRKPPVDATLLRRAGFAGAQVGLGARARRANTDHAFTVTKPCDNLRVAVVDDVVTTAATASAIATALKRRGAGQVEIWCLARTPLPGSTT